MAGGHLKFLTQCNGTLNVINNITHLVPTIGNGNQKIADMFGLKVLLNCTVLVAQHLILSIVCLQEMKYVTAQVSILNPHPDEIVADNGVIITLSNICNPAN